MVDAVLQPLDVLMYAYPSKQVTMYSPVTGHQRHELDLLRRERLVREGALQRVVVMRANCDQGAPPADVLMKLVLQAWTA